MFSSKFMEKFFGREVLIVSDGGVVSQGVIYGWEDEETKDVIIMEGMLKRRKASPISSNVRVPGSVTVETVKTRKYLLVSGIVSVDELNVDSSSKDYLKVVEPASEEEIGD